MLIKFVNKLLNSLKSNKNIKFYYNKNILELITLLKNNHLLVYKIISITEKPSPKIEMEILDCNIKNLKFISKPSRTIHVSYKELQSIPYFCILSTNEGIISKEHALQLKIGGILLLKVEIE